VSFEISSARLQASDYFINAACACNESLCQTIYGRDLIFRFRANTHFVAEHKTCAQKKDHLAVVFLDRLVGDQQASVVLQTGFTFSACGPF
jgi:hypothetical protein